ncbi:hypothetical protein HOLleu_36285 [Holothuria leucospilota]|uniref:Uncharacterized protein n=1 Tax=Holothuria leucospilota TaxID=206669 RepID=A0A9Q0YJL8_HOLLE|nr:hypothetical protein HOLleu_36285 [Holothuria leucospilota]
MKVSGRRKLRCGAKHSLNALGPRGHSKGPGWLQWQRQCLATCKCLYMSTKQTTNIKELPDSLDSDRCSPGCRKGPNKGLPQAADLERTNSYTAFLVHLRCTCGTRPRPLVHISPYAGIEYPAVVAPGGGRGAMAPVGEGCPPFGERLTEQRLAISSGSTGVFDTAYSTHSTNGSLQNNMATESGICRWICLEILLFLGTTSAVDEHTSTCTLEAILILGTN